MKRILISLFISLVLSALFLFASAETAVDVTSQCKFLVSEGKKSILTDRAYKDDRTWIPKGNEPTIKIMLPDSGADHIEIAWRHLATDFTLTEYDASQTQTHVTRASDDEGIYLTQTYKLAEDTRYVFLTFSQQDQGVCEIRLYKGSDLPSNVNHWEPQHAKCDLMVISTHQDDEWLWFGGIIPYYNGVADRNVQVMYMANCGRSRYQEALNALTVAGVRNMPVFLDLKDERIDSFKETVAHWGGSEHVLEVVVEQIRKYRPEVILTHDWNGEYGHNQHKATSRCMEYAIEAAADPSRFPDSYAEYGAWQVKKLYRHLETKCPITFDWHIPYDQFGGKTALQVASEAMEQNASQLKWYHVEDHGKYDNTLFGLSYSVVGDDVLHNDLFENID